MTDRENVYVSLQLEFHQDNVTARSLKLAAG